MPPTESHVVRNRRVWDAWSERYRDPGRRAWASDRPVWGIWSIPEGDLRALPDVDGLDVLEMGCGTAYWSAWLARRGARPVALDNSALQLASARAFQDEFGPRFPLVHADAEAAPLRDNSFDLVLSEYGASIWCDPYRWVPEVARVLRPGGRLVMLVNSTLSMLCTPADGSQTGATLERDLFGMHRFEWPDGDSVEFHLSPGERIRLFGRCGLVVEELFELQAPEDGDSGPWDYVTLDWSRRWPAEEIWRARRT